MEAMLYESLLDIARFRGNVRLYRSGSMPLIVGEKNRCQVSLRIQRKKETERNKNAMFFIFLPKKSLKSS